VTATEQVEPDRVYALAKGMAECRAGHHKQAIQWLTKFGPKTTGTCEDATGFALLAIAQRGAGDRAAARATLVQAREMMAKMPDPAKGEVFGGWSYVEWMQCRLLCQEAEKLLAEPATTQKSR